MDRLIREFADRAIRYIESIGNRRVSPSPDATESLQYFDRPLQDEPVDPLTVLAELDDYGSPATVATTGGRYFGLVQGGALPAAMSANLFAGVWDQNAAFEFLSPVASTLEIVCRKWLLSLLGLDRDAGVGFTSGATMANFAGLASARHALLAQEGWDVEAKGLFGAPPLTVVVGEEAHVTVFKALGMLGLGRDRVIRVPVDGQGRMLTDALPKIERPTIVCTQAGNVNTGSFDPVGAICQVVNDDRVWVHVDGAFGLWAAASPNRSHLVEGVQLADSWATDAHKWLNVPYDSGIVIVRNPKDLQAAMSASAAYLLAGENREPCHFVPELSRRARGVEIWAALRSLGRSGLASLVERTCGHASKFAERLAAEGYEILNDVELNEVLVSFGNPEVTRKTISRIQSDGTCWCGGTEWQGHVAMRICVSCWATTDEDVEKSLEAILRCAAEAAATD